MASWFVMLAAGDNQSSISVILSLLPYLLAGIPPERETSPYLLLWLLRGMVHTGKAE